MILHPPFIITARLLSGLRVSGAFISIEPVGWTEDGRQQFRYCIDLPGGSEFEAEDLKSGVGGCGLQEAFGTLLGFLGAAAEARQGRERRGQDEHDEDSNESLFPAPVVEWAAQNSDEISILQYEIEETPGLIEVQP